MTPSQVAALESKDAATAAARRDNCGEAFKFGPPPPDCPAFASGTSLVRPRRRDGGVHAYLSGCPLWMIRPERTGPRSVKAPTFRPFLRGPVGIRHGAEGRRRTRRAVAPDRRGPRGISTRRGSAAGGTDAGCRWSGCAGCWGRVDGNGGQVGGTVSSMQKSKTIFDATERRVS